MKAKLLNPARLLHLCIVAALAFVLSSCDKTETTDSTGFILHYYGVTDIGPSMSYTLEAPSYKGSAPYDFTITGVTLDNETFSNNDNFVIDAETGAITIQNTSSMATGLYNISVGCYSNGKHFSFKNAVQVNMLLAVPEGVTVEPAVVVVKLEEENWWEANAKVTTDTEKHVSITEYAIAEDESKAYLKYFTISNDGVITFNADQKDNIVAGEQYTLSLKLKTRAGEHLYPDAVTFNVISKPYNLQYKPNAVKIEKGASHESQLPTIQGSTGISYAIKSVTPELDGISIDEQTGQIKIAENVLSIVDAVYKIDVTASNEYGSTDFAEVYTVTVSNFITPIEPATFKYTVPETYENLAYSFTKDAGFIGDEVIFTLADASSDAIKTQEQAGRIEVDKETGTVTLLRTNTLAPGTYTVAILAKNSKGEATASFTLNIKANPNKFTVCYYGNNLGLSPVENYANQFEVNNLKELKALDLQPVTDLGERTATWKLTVKKVLGAKDQLSGTTIDPATGKIDFSNAKLQDALCIGMLVVEATVGEGELAYTVTTPVFVRYNVTKNKGLLKYKPFVMQVNPKTGGRSAVPETVEPANLTVDFRANFNFFEVNTTTEDGVQPATAGSIMNELWTKFYETTKANGGIVNTGAKKPMSSLDTANGFDNTKHLDMTLGYIDQTDLSVVINPDMWKSSSSGYANGVLIPQVAFSTDGSVPNSNRFIPIAIWFDENFE